MTMHYTRFAQQIVKEEYCRRVESLNAVHVSAERVRRLATFLALNQQNQTIIHLSSWLHHLRRANTAFQEADRKVLPLICAKLLRNERVFRSWLESCGHVRGKREEEKFIQQADLRSVLAKFGVSYINQEMFLKEFSKGDQVHVEDLVTRVKAMTRQHYQATGQTASGEDFEPNSMAELRKTDYFSKVHQAIRSTGVEVDTQDLLRQFRGFDTAQTGSLKVYILINVLKHNYRSVFSEECLIGLQFQLECLSGDGTIDYEEFTKIFLEDSASKAKPAQELRLDRKSPYNLQDYEDLLSRISSHVKEQGLDLMRIFEIFCKQGGFISFEDLRKILDLIEFPVTEQQFELIRRFADENNAGTVHAYEFVQLVAHSKEITPSYDVHRWIVASRELAGRYRLLELLQGAIESIKEQMLTRYGDAEARHSGVLTAESLAELLAAECPSLSEPDKHLLCVFAVKGSRRVHANAGGQASSAAVDLSSDLVQFFHVAKALEDVIQHMRREALV
jgi:Ca2+-binding EF-hand superfamily protein